MIEFDASFLEEMKTVIYWLGDSNECLLKARASFSRLSSSCLITGIDWNSKLDIPKGFLIESCNLRSG